MPLITRRGLLTGFGASALGATSLGAYAVGVEPMRIRVQQYAVTPPRWPAGLKLRIAAIADVHACEPWMPADHVADIVTLANAQKPDIVVLLGDYEARHRWVRRLVPASEWSAAFAGLRAPLGVHAIMGNHDWWDDPKAQARGGGPVFGRLALENVGIPVYENDAVRLTKDGRPFWLAGLGDQLALPRWINRSGRHRGVDDLAGMLAKVTDDAPIIVIAHEPDVFPSVPERVALTLCGHTHGGQVRVLGFAPAVPSRYGPRYAYGHLSEARLGHDNDPRHLIVSGGIGCSLAPIRFGVPPEIVVVDVGSEILAR